MTRELPSQIATDVSSGVVYQTFGPVPSWARREAERVMAALAEIAPRPVIHSKVKVRIDEGRGPGQRSVVQGVMDISGIIVRAQAAASTPVAALRAVGDRIERRITSLAEKRQRATKRPPATPPGQWRRGDLPDDRPDFFERPPEDRMVVKRKTYSPMDQISVSEALFDLDVLDHRFYLFIDEADVKPSIVYEGGERLTIQKIDGSSPDREAPRPDIEVNETPAPSLTVAESVSLLNTGDAVFVFFCDSDRRRASVLYRRYDGHYGLIVPSTSFR